MKYFIKTYGCQMNVSDSDSMSLLLSKSGFPETSDINEAGIVILNTCSVRQLPEQKAYSFLGRAQLLKAKKPALKVIVAGCMAQRAESDIKKRFPFVDLVFGAKNITRFPEILKAALDKWQLLDLAEEPRPVNSPVRPVSVFVTIMRGCDNYCSYCVVPFVRGIEISRPSKEILCEIEGLAKLGVKEVTLLGQNVNSYKDSSRFVDFPGLLDAINGIDGIERIRFMTSHPKDLSDKLIDSMANLKKVCEHIHLPLQSGSDDILNKMNRSYTATDYTRIIDKITKAMPSINITTDILVGFPGETENDFKETLNIIQTVGFDSLFAFKYSSRPGTKAAGLTDNVSLPEKEERLKRVLELGNGISSKKNAKLINSVHEVLVDTKDGDLCEGRTRSNKKVSFASVIDLKGKVVAVKIADVKINSLSGKLERVLR